MIHTHSDVKIAYQMMMSSLDTTAYYLYKLLHDALGLESSEYRLVDLSPDSSLPTWARKFVHPPIMFGATDEKAWMCAVETRLDDNQHREPLRVAFQIKRRLRDNQENTDPLEYDVSVFRQQRSQVVAADSISVNPKTDSSVRAFGEWASDRILQAAIGAGKNPSF